MEIKEDLFDNVKPGSRVHYLTAQGQTRSGTVVMNRGTHLVLNRGGGQPQVVTPKNYVKHSEGGKVKGALLSNLAKSMKKESVDEGAIKKLVAKVTNSDKWHDSMRAKHGSEKWNNYWKGVQSKKMDVRDKVLNTGFKTEAKLPRTGTDEIADMEPKVNAVYDMDPRLKSVLTKKLLKKKKQIVKEDAQLDAQKSALAYTTKMQKKKKKRTLKTMKEEILNELGGETLSRYVTKALSDRKKQAGMADMAHRIHTPERAKYFADKAAARIAKRGAGIKTAVAKIASNLPAEPLAAHTAGEKSKHGGWSGMEARESEYRANQQLAGSTPRRQPGHYLTRDGRTLSGPHKPDEAVRAYKDMSDNKNVKIVHVKEAVDNKEKASKVAKRAIALAKSKKKTNVNVEPELETPSSQMSQPLLQGAEGPTNVRV